MLFSKDPRQTSKWFSMDRSNEDGSWFNFELFPNEKLVDANNPWVEPAVVEEPAESHVAILLALGAAIAIVVAYAIRYQTFPSIF